MKRGILTRDDLLRRSRVDPYDPNPYCPCWHWLGGKSTDGTPRIWTLDHERVDKRCMSGPKAVWNISRGRGPGDHLVYRTCGAIDCVQPGHHALARDKAQIGAHQRHMGLRKGKHLEQRRANLVHAWAAAGTIPTAPELVLAARAATGTNTEIARMLGMSRTTVGAIRRGLTRRDVAAPGQGA